MKKVFSIILSAILFAACGMTAFAAPQQMPDGGMFDAEYYTEANPDVVAAMNANQELVAVCGGMNAALYLHYKNFGAGEGRLPYAPATAAASVAPTAEQPAAAQAYTVPGTASSGAAVHNYYRGLSSNIVAQADAVAQEIAASIMGNPALTTDLQRVNEAARVVAAYCAGSTYARDAAGAYRSPAGPFVFGVYTCAGSTRALGRVLDFMGYSWVHVNENQDRHQWVIVTLDGQAGFADGQGGFAGYGQMTSGMMLPDDRRIFFSA